MQKYLEKANVLIEALPYIRKFSSKIILIKYGGSAMENEELKHCVMQDIALLKLVGLKPIIVHGGGKDISKMCEKLGVKSEFNNGLRVSDQATTEVASMVLNYINKNLVHSLQNLGVKAIGLCGKDGGLLECVQKDENLGFVGEIQKVNSSVLQDLLEKDFLPIIAPIGMDENFNTYNINADDAACVIAKALKAEKLAFLTDIAGLYENFEDKNSLISKISITQAKALVDKIQGGMHVKLKSCIDACESGVKKVHILDGRVKHSLLLEFFTDEGIGTLVGYRMKMNYKEQSHIIPTYKRFDIVLESGEGVYLLDDKGKKYLDFSSGIGVCALGYNHAEFNAKIKAQVDKLLHTSNLYYNENIAQAAKHLAKASGLERVFFTNSGAESIEGAMKVARKYAFNKGIKGGNFIAFKHSFHGRTLGALSLTANEKYQKPFKPLISGVKFAKYNDFSSVERLVNEKTCAIILESVQGEGGVNPAQKDFYKALRKLCDEKDILLIADEIQCGMGRSGKFFAYEHSGILPDVMTSAKALGCGLSVGAFVVSEKVAQKSLEAGDHGSTYGGNPLVCAGVNAVFEIFKKEKILENVSKLTPYLEQSLENLIKEFRFCKKRKGLGFMQGLSLDKSVKVAEVIKKCQENSLLLISCGENDLRFLPSLIIEKSHIDEMSEKLRKVFKSFE